MAKKGASTNARRLMSSGDCCEKSGFNPNSYEAEDDNSDDNNYGGYVLRENIGISQLRPNVL